MSCHRLFVALRPPPPIRAILLGVMHGSAGLRWQVDDQLHITLRFIGEVDHHQAEDIAAVLGHLHAPALDLRFSGVGQFEKSGRPHTLWAGITPAEAIAALHRKINQLLTDVGIPPDSRAFLPHLTLARGNRNTAPLAPYLSSHAAFSTPIFRCDHVILYESEMGHGGSRYHPVARYPLLAPPHADSMDAPTAVTYHASR